jgi:hypothetical protein
MRETDPVTFDFDAPFPKFDRFPDGSWIVANSRCSPGAANAHIISFKGTLLRRLRLGDGIHHLQCDTFSNIWVGCFDEAVGGDTITSDGSAPIPQGDAGLAKCDAEERMIFSFNADVQDDDMIVDCYALNVTDSAYACCYHAWPILKVDKTGHKILWNNHIAGATALIVDENFVILVGGYSGERGRLELLRLVEDRAEVIGEAEIDPGLVDPRDGLLRIGRANQLHFFNDKTWFQITVVDVVRAIAGRPRLS